ncbi:MAG: hypothetical protein LBG77_02750 [Dysgonamonadaceae bacterium]|jgi:hypothetical protein|nr:hypothetical protein [Dysgonamonadaceae bacterium]
MKNSVLILSLCAICLSSTGTGCAQQVETCNLPACYSESTNFQVSVNGQKIPVSTTFGVYEYAHYLFSGTSNITVTIQNDIISFNISSLAYEIEGMANGKTLSFTLNQSRYLILKINSLPELIAGQPHQKAFNLSKKEKDYHCIP